MQALSSGALRVCTCLTAVKGRKQIAKRCNYKAAVATRCPARKRTECKETLGTCTVLAPRS
jgi:hypothetical protein